MIDAGDVVADAVARWRGAGARLIGLCGPQGAGKSTIAARLATLPGIAVLSLDDLYFAHDVRARLASRVHPLLATRGVPGTHDVALGMRVLDALLGGEAVTLPRFDKATDDPWPVADWAMVRADTVIVEGWCVGARAQDDVSVPVNALEADEDAGGVWRTYANDQLRRPYRALFDRLDRLALLLAPDWDTILGWRRQQERDLGAGPRTLTPDGVARFVAHFERITRHVAAEMPARADLVVRLDAARDVMGVTERGGPC